MSFIQEKQDLLSYIATISAVSDSHECTDNAFVIITGILEQSHEIIANKKIQQFFSTSDHPLDEYNNIKRIVQDEQDRLDIINNILESNPDTYLLPNEQRELIMQAQETMNNLQPRIDDIKPIEYKLQVMLELHKTNTIYPMYMIDDVLSEVLACEKSELDLADILFHDNTECNNDVLRSFNKDNDYVLHQNADSNYDALQFIGSVVSSSVTEEDWVWL